MSPIRASGTSWNRPRVAARSGFAPSWTAIAYAKTPTRNEWAATDSGCCTPAKSHPALGRRLSWPTSYRNSTIRSASDMRTIFLRIEVPRHRPDDLGDELHVLLVRRVAAPAQVGLHLVLEELDHVLDQAVQFLRGTAARLGDGRLRVDQAHGQRLRAAAAFRHAELDAL